MMNKSKLIKAVSKKTGYSDFQCKKIIECFLDAIKYYLAEGEDVSLVGLASFEIRKKPARKGRHPKTGVVYTFPSIKYIKCKISKPIREAVKNKE